MTNLRLAFLSNGKKLSVETAETLRQRFGDHPPEDCDVIVAVGGDGFMLETLRGQMTNGKPIYGINCGTVGFLMNSGNTDDLPGRIADAEAATIHPLAMSATTVTGKTETATAINEISLFRQTRQSARISISVNDKVRMPSLTCDGILLATPAGSTAYNLSAHAPILPIDAHLLALTPISAFRPRRWRGALLPHNAVVRFETAGVGRRRQSGGQKCCFG